MSDLLSAVIILFLAMDPLGNVPFFLSALKHVDPARQRRVVVRELLIALGFLVFFLFAGRWLDERLGTEPWLLLVGVLVGATAGFYSMYRQLVIAPRRREENREEE